MWVADGGLFTFPALVGKTDLDSQINTLVVAASRYAGWLQRVSIVIVVSYPDLVLLCGPTSSPLFFSGWRAQCCGIGSTGMGWL